MEQGAVIAYYDEKKFTLAVVSRVQNSKVNLITEKNVEKKINTNRIVFVSSDRLDTDSSGHELAEKLKEIGEKQQALEKEICVKEIWEVLEGETGPFDSKYISELAFGGENTSDHEAAVHRKLFRDRLYFKSKGAEFMVNSRETVEKNRMRIEREAERERMLSASARWLEDIWNDQLHEAPSNKSDIIEMLKQFVLFGSDAPRFKETKELLSRVDIAADDKPFRLLVKMGIWDENENLLLHQMDIPLEWSEKTLAEARRIYEDCKEIDADPLNRQRQEFRNLFTVTIDGEHTEDFDDAVSMEIDDTNILKIGIHITDVASLIPVESELSEEARERSVTVYLPEQRIPMLPPLLSEDLLSLKENVPRRVVSLMMEIDENNEIINWEFYPALIKVSERMTYDQANQKIESDPLFKRTWEFTKALREKRLAAGALIQSKPELEIKVTGKDDIEIRALPDNTPGRVMISELMIRYNHLAGVFLADHDVKSIFRSQRGPENKLISYEEFDPLLFYRQRRMLNRAEITIEPEHHFSLGVNPYMTCTSPIRRFFDLACQRQILSLFYDYIHPYDEEELNKIIMISEERKKNASRLQWRRERYWLIKYMEKRIGHIFDAVILDQSASRYRIIIPAFLLEFDVFDSRINNLHPGEKVQVKIEQARARAGNIRASILPPADRTVEESDHLK